MIMSTENMETLSSIDIPELTYQPRWRFSNTHSACVIVATTDHLIASDLNAAH